MKWQGMRFPFSFQNGYSTDLENIRQSILLILATRRRERPFRPDLGSNLFDLIDAPLNTKTKAQIVYECINAIREYEPRVVLRKVEVTSPVPGQVLIRTEYEVPDLKTKDVLELVWDRVEQKWRR